MAVVEDDSSSNPSSQLRKAKTELQDGFQLSYQPAALNQLQDGGDNLSTLIPFLLLSSQQSFPFLFRHHLHFVVHIPFPNTSQQLAEMQKIIVYHLLFIFIIYFAGSLFQHVSTAGRDAENNAENQGQLKTMWNMALVCSV